MGIPRRVIDLAAKQGGYVRRDQLVALGLSESAVDRRANERVITPVTPGVYQVIPSDDHVDLLRGAILALPNAVVSHHSAAHLLRFPRLPALKPTVVVPSHTTHRFPAVIVRRCNDLSADDVVIVNGLPVTSVARTCFDLSGLLKFKQFDAIGESVLIAERLDIDEYADLVDRLARRGKPGSKASRDFLEIRLTGSDRRATILERKGRAILSAAGLPDPVPQFPIPWSPGRRFDDAYPDVLVAIEWDSMLWHQQRRSMNNDRRRDRGAAAHGWILLRFTWDDVVDNPEEVAETVTTVLRERKAAG